jgi:hypothetical protein
VLRGFILARNAPKKETPSEQHGAANPNATFTQEDLLVVLAKIMTGLKNVTGTW